MRWLTWLLHRRPSHDRDLEHFAPNGDRLPIGRYQGEGRVRRQFEMLSPDEIRRIRREWGL